MALKIRQESPPGIPELFAALMLWAATLLLPVVRLLGPLPYAKVFEDLFDYFLVLYNAYDLHHAGTFWAGEGINLIYFLDQPEINGMRYQMQNS